MLEVNMPTFVSPSGNTEIWDVCPAGYIDHAVWLEQQHKAWLATFESSEERFVRLRADRDNLLLEYDRLVLELMRKLRLAETDFDRKEVEAALLHLDEWAVTICDITVADGAPFNGSVPYEHRRGFM